LEQDESNEASKRQSRRGWLLGGGVVAAVLVGPAVAIAVPDGDERGVLTDAERASITASLMRDVSAASPGQQAVLADGNIEVAEMVALAKDASECSIAQGSLPFEVAWNRNRLDRVQHFDPELSIDELERLLAISDRCWDEHLGIVEMLNAIDMVPSVGAQQQYNQDVEACLLSRGQPGEGWPATDKVVDASVEAICVEEVDGG
jgi:hypothetical protein